MSKSAVRYRPDSFEPTQEQIDIQMASDEAMMIEANAGAGKTTTLALRIAQAIKSGTDPARIKVLTFTEPACEAMVDALKKIGLDWRFSQKIGIQTFDQFAQSILHGLERKRIPFLPTKEDVAPYVHQVVHALDIPADSDFVERFLNASQKIKGTLIREQKLWRDEALTEDDSENLQIDPVFFKVTKAYEHLRFPNRDGSDRPLFRGPFDATYDLACLLGNPEPTTYVSEIPDWPTHIRMLLIDEMHDMNEAMSIITRKLLETNALHFCGVGDSDQVIHSASGAEQRFMSADIDFGNGSIKRYPLTATHRFSQSLGQIAGALADKPYASKADHETKVQRRVYAASEGVDCADVIINVAKGWYVQESGNMSEFAIVLRHPWQSIHIENALLKHEFYYDIKGFKSYALQPEVLFIRFIFAYAANDYKQFKSLPKTVNDMIRALVFFFQIELGYELDDGDSPDARMKYAIEQITHEPSLFETFFENQILKNASLDMKRRTQAAIKTIKEGAGHKDWFESLLTALEISMWVKNIFVEQQRKFDALQNFEGLKKAAQSFLSPAAFFDSIERHEGRLVAAPNSKHKEAVRKAIDTKKTLTITTIPNIKGLEYDHVVIPYLTRGLFPSDLNADARDERNLFYVAITRARKQLTLIGHEKYPSSFLSSISE